MASHSPQFVLDTSVSAAWILPTQATPYKIAVLKTLDTQKAVVPALWQLEMASILVKFAKKNKIVAHDLAVLNQSILDLPIEIDSFGANTHAIKFFQSTCATALEFGLSVYDAQYLNLALRRNLPLATCDLALQHAASAMGVEILKA